MNTNAKHLAMFLLADTLKRLCAAQYKGSRSRLKAIAEYDNEAARVRRDFPEEFKAFAKAFGIDPNANGAQLLN